VKNEYIEKQLEVGELRDFKLCIVIILGDNLFIFLNSAVKQICSHTRYSYDLIICNIFPSSLTEFTPGGKMKDYIIISMETPRWLR